MYHFTEQVDFNFFEINFGLTSVYNTSGTAVWPNISMHTAITWCAVVPLSMGAMTGQSE